MLEEALFVLDGNLTDDIKSFAGFTLDPVAIDVGLVLEEGRVVELDEE